MRNHAVTGLSENVREGCESRPSTDRRRKQDGRSEGKGNRWHFSTDHFLNTKFDKICDLCNFLKTAW